MGETDGGGNWVLPVSLPFGGGTAFPPFCLTWGQTMVEVMKVTVISFKRFQCPQPCSRPPPTHISIRDSWQLRGKSVESLVGSLLLSPGSWCTQGFVCPSKSLFPQSCVSSGSSMEGLMVTSSKRAYVIPRAAARRAPAPVAGPCWPIPPQETLKHSKAGLREHVA